MPRKKPLFGVGFTGADLLQQVLSVRGIAWPVHTIPWSSNSQSTAEIDTKKWKMTKRVIQSCVATLIARANESVYTAT
jgi:hypothetical protein